MNYFYKLAIAVDQLANVIVGGYPDETLSARTWRKSKESKKWEMFRFFVDLIFFFDPDHCFTSYLSEQDRKHYPAYYRK